MICWGRPLLADPELPLKVQTGRLKEVVPCIACNQGCFDSLAVGLPICCTLNPRVGRERETEIGKATTRKRILVAGGGPGGMEFAVTAAQRGHDVTLYEKDTRLGGQINLIGVVPGKKVFQEAVRSFIDRLDVSGVRVKLNTSLTTKMIEEDRPDVTVVASGAVPVVVTFEGAGRPNVVSAWDVIKGDVPDIGRHVVIVGGSAAGCETALFVASLNTPDPEVSGFLLFHHADKRERIMDLFYDAGRKITVIDQLDHLAANVGPSTRWSLLKSLGLLGVDQRPGTRLVRIIEDSVIVEGKSGRESIPADTVIIAVGSRPVDNLSREIDPGMTEVITIGDAKEPRKIIDAVREGFDAALKI
jgi:2,4-dienoyl-CoA reductase (NADPH2)